jgi:hypothetical protein
MTTTAGANGTVRLLGVDYRPAPSDRSATPTLYVVVDTEAEFNWDEPFARDLTRIDSIAAQHRTQSIFDRYGLRPVYLVDYPVASQPEGWRPLRAMMERGACEIGAHLHPWTNPPFYEQVSTFNSYPGNLSAQTEQTKLEHLLSVIERNFGIRPVFYKAGRYGIGPDTIGLIARHGIMVDFSILPGADLTAGGGPDFRQMRPVPYLASVAGSRPILSMPMTRAQIGPLSELASQLAPLLDSGLARRLRLRGALAGLGLLRKATLTPEGVPLKLQKALVTDLLRRGQTQFVMHYHSPSLVPGNTPYVRTAAELDMFLDSIAGLCRFFFRELGGHPGDPSSLVGLADQALASNSAA